MRDDLETAVEKVYRAFAHVRLTDRVDYCDHCVDPEQVEALRRTPLRELTPEDLGPLLYNAVSTWGDLRYFTHFLPRLLQLVAAGDMEDWSYAIFLPSRLRSCGAEGSSEEQRAIAGFMKAWWLATISSWPGRCAPRAVLETIDAAGDRVVPYLHAWSAQPGEAAARHLAAFIRDWMVSTMTDDQFWVDVDRWLRDPQPRDLLTTAFMDTSDPLVAEELGNADDTLARYRSWSETEHAESPS